MEYFNPSSRPLDLYQFTKKSTKSWTSATVEKNDQLKCTLINLWYRPYSV